MTKRLNEKSLVKLQNWKMLLLGVEDAAARDRSKAEDLAARDRHAEKLRLQEQSVRDQEEVRRKTDEALRNKGWKTRSK